MNWQLPKVEEPKKLKFIPAVIRPYDSRSMKLEPNRRKRDMERYIKLEYEAGKFLNLLQIGEADAKFGLRRPVWSVRPGKAGMRFYSKGTHNKKGALRNGYAWLTVYLDHTFDAWSTERIVPEAIGL